ncbi:DASH complex subunit Spc19 [Xylariales sp. AK1849]|nr:DASH complex subunit Spc19 [Xylariales sp. AK1849]
MATHTISTGHVSTYGDCVSALRSSLGYLESSVSTLGTGVADFPRLVRVLKSVRHYELIPHPTLAAAESSLRDEIGPAISVLLDRADGHIDRVERRIESLKARAELQQGRLSETPSSTTGPSAHGKGKGKGVGGRGGAPGAVKGLGGEAKLRAKAVKQRREALEYSIERLELEVLQKERELRKEVGKA